MATQAVVQKADLNIPNFTPEADPDSTALQWERWLKGFARKMRFFGIKETQDKLDALYIYGGQEVENLLETLPNRNPIAVPDYIKPADEQENDFHRAVDKLSQFFISKTNKRCCKEQV